MKKKNRITYAITDATASRAIYQEGGLPLISCTLETINGELIVFEIPFELATKFVDQINIAYEVAIPRRRR